MTSKSAETKSIQKIAYELACRHNAHRWSDGDNDLGYLFDEDEHGHLTKAKWIMAVDLAVEMLPTARPSRELVAQVSRAARDWNAEAKAELAALGYSR